MVRNTLSHLVLPMIAAVVLVVWPTEALAQRGGSRGGGSFHGGTVGGFNPGFNRGFRPFYGYGVYPYYGSSYYTNYYYQNYWAYPATSNYDSGFDLSTWSIPAADPGSTTPVPPTSGTTSITPSGQGETVSQSSTVDVTRITVRLPANADLWFDGKKMTATGTVRTFSLPPLTSGSRYSYAVRAPLGRERHYYGSDPDDCVYSWFRLRRKLSGSVRHG